MRYRDCMVAWNPSTDQIRVDWFKPPVYGRWANHPIDYLMTVGGCESEVKRLDRLTTKCRVLSEFVSAVVRDDVDLDAAYRQFLKIDEFRWAIPIDCDGAEEEPDESTTP